MEKCFAQDRQITYRKVAEKTNFGLKLFAKILKKNIFCPKIDLDKININLKIANKILIRHKNSFRGPGNIYYTPQTGSLHQ